MATESGVTSKVTYCLLHPTKTASTTVHAMPVCLHCYRAVAAEERQHLPYAERSVYRRLVRAQRGRDVQTGETTHV